MGTLTIEQDPAERRKNWILKVLVVTILTSGILGGFVSAGVEYMLGSNLVEITITEGELLALLVFGYGFVHLAGRDAVQLLNEVMDGGE